MSTNKPSPGGPDSRLLSLDAIEQTAAEWLALREGRELTPAEQATYAAWLAADPRHATVAAELDLSWRTFDRLARYPRPAGVAADPDFLARPQPFRRVRRVAGPALLAAASIALLVWLRPWAPPVQPAVVAAATTRLMHLPDGSEVELNVGAEIAEKFSAAERRIQLVQGEAHFTVTKNPARPFIVSAAGVSVQAVGTAFDVRLGASAVDVLVTDGQVSVAGPAAGGQAPLPAALLVAGQRTTVATGAVSRPAIENLAASDIDRLLAWQANRLVFDATPLAEAVARINRHTAGQPGAPHLLLGEPKLGELRVSGRIRADNIESFVESLETGFGVTAHRGPDGEIVLKSAP